MDTAPQKREGAEEGAVGGDAEVNADPDIHPMEWMHNRQHCYNDEMIIFWPLLRPLTDGGGTTMQCLACRLLSTWEWSSATHPTSCPPAPTNIEIGRWLPLDRDDREGSREDLWIEAYACCLQHVAEASTGLSWVAEGEGMVPRVSPLTQAFLSATGRRISPSILWECWPPKHDIVPRQPMSKVRTCITRCLDQVATQSPSNIAWDIFAWPDTNKDRWGEDCLPYSPGSTVDLSSWMPGIRLVLHDKTGKYQGVAHVLKYEGHMLVYDPQTNGTGWVAMRGIPSLLTEVESRSASDLGNFYPIPCTAPAGQHPQGRHKGNMHRLEPSHLNPQWNFDKYIDWDTDDVQDRSCTPSSVTIIGEPTQGATEETPPAWQNQCLVPERVLEPGVVPHREDTPVTEETKTQKDENTPMSTEQSTPVAEDDVVVLYAGVEDL